MQKTRLAGRKLSQQRLLLTLKLTQNAIDQPLKLWALNSNSTFNRFREAACGGIRVCNSW